MAMSKQAQLALVLEMTGHEVEGNQMTKYGSAIVRFGEGVTGQASVHISCSHNRGEQKFTIELSRPSFSGGLLQAVVNDCFMAEALRLASQLQSVLEKDLA